MRSFKTLFRVTQTLFFLNLALFALGCTAAVLFFLGYFDTDTIEARRVILRGQNGVPMMVLQGDTNSTLLTLNDAEGRVRLQLQGGDFPALMMKNSANEVVGTFFPLSEGGAAIGLGNLEGEMATFIRGGESPGIGLYSHSQTPQVAMGISQGVPHFLLFPVVGSEGMVIDGSQSASLLFFDDQGQVPVTLSRYGLYQNEEGNEDEEEEFKEPAKPMP